jgi:hypothetical protein
MRERNADPFGIPDNVFGPVDDDFYGAIGRIVALGALVEQKYGDMIDQIGGPGATQPGRQLSTLDKRFCSIAKSRTQQKDPLPERVIAVHRRVVAAMKKRNSLVHSIWPNPTADVAKGWRMPPRGPNVEWTETTETDLRILIDEMVTISFELRDVVSETGAWSRATPSGSPHDSNEPNARPVP